MCLFVYDVDHGVNEGEPAGEQFYEQANEDQFRDPESEVLSFGLGVEDQFRDPESEGQYFDQDLPEGFEDGKFNPIL